MTSSTTITAICLACWILASSIGIANAGGGHGQAAPTDTEVKWVIPGTHNHGDGTAHGHDAGVELGQGKTLRVNVGDQVTFKWDGNYPHDLMEMKDANALTDCNFDGSTPIVSPATSEANHTITITDKTYYFSCSVGSGSHCEQGQKLIVVGSVSCSAPLRSAMVVAIALLSAVFVQSM